MHVNRFRKFNDVQYIGDCEFPSEQAKYVVSCVFNRAWGISEPYLDTCESKYTMVRYEYRYFVALLVARDLKVAEVAVCLAETHQFE